MTPPSDREGAAAMAAPVPADAELAVARMVEMSADLRGCAVLDGTGKVLAASGPAESWGDPARALVAAADAAGGRSAAHAHIATEAGEAFVVREGGLVIVAVTERFALASLMVFDMRTVLRDLASGDGVPDRRKPHPRELADDEADG